MGSWEGTCTDQLREDIFIDQQHAICSSLTSQPHSDRIAPRDAGGLGGHPTTWRAMMIKVSVMYANTPGARFNHEYYRDKHMPHLL